MTQHGDPDLVVADLVQFIGHPLGDAPQPFGGQGIFALLVDLLPTHWPGSLGHHDDAELAACPVALLDLFVHLVQVEGDFGDQDHVGPTGQPRPQGQPARVAPHDLHDHDAVVRFGRGVQLVQGVGGRVEGCVETEGNVRTPQVVVNGLGHPDHGHPHLIELVGDFQ